MRRCEKEMFYMAVLIRDVHLLWDTQTRFSRLSELSEVSRLVH